MSLQRVRSARVLLAPALLLALSACAEIQRDPGVMFASNPSGARVVVDGVDSGFVTPCHLDIPRAAHDIDLVLEGHAPASVHIDATGDTWLILWDEAYVNENTWRSPLWLNARDGLFPASFTKLDKGGTPVVGVIVSSVLASALVAANYSRSLVQVFTFSILLSTATLLLSGVIAALYERLVENQTLASSWIWLGGALLLTLPVLARLA